MMPNLWLSFGDGSIINIAAAVEIEPAENDPTSCRVFWSRRTDDWIDLEGTSVEDVRLLIKNRIEEANKALIKGLAEKLRADAAPFSLEEITSAQDQINGG